MRRDHIIKQVETTPRQPTRMLEIGCGNGSILASIALRAPHIWVVGLDINVAALQHQRSNYDQPTIQGDALQLPVAQSFDLIGAFDVLEHIQDDNAALSNIYNALKPGGTLILTVPQHMRLYTNFDIAAGHVRRYERHLLEAQLARVGFSITSSFSFNYLLLPIVALTRLWKTLFPYRDKSLYFQTELHISPFANYVGNITRILEQILAMAGLQARVGTSLLLVCRTAYD